MPAHEVDSFKPSNQESSDGIRPVRHRLLRREDRPSGEVSGKVGDVGEQTALLLLFHLENLRRRKNIGINSMRAETGDATCQIVADGDLRDSVWPPSALVCEMGGDPVGERARARDTDPLAPEAVQRVNWRVPWHSDTGWKHLRLVLADGKNRCALGGEGHSRTSGDADIDAPRHHSLDQLAATREVHDLHVELVLFENPEFHSEVDR